MKHQITATKILVEWNDSPKMEILFNEMPSDLEQLYNKWQKVLNMKETWEISND